MKENDDSDDKDAYCVELSTSKHSCWTSLTQNNERVCVVHGYLVAALFRQICQGNRGFVVTTELCGSV
jgi:hypothetical protein